MTRWQLLTIYGLPDDQEMFRLQDKLTGNYYPIGDITIEQLEEIINHLNMVETMTDMFQRIHAERIANDSQRS